MLKPAGETERFVAIQNINFARHGRDISRPCNDVSGRGMALPCPGNLAYSVFNIIVPAIDGGFVGTAYMPSAADVAQAYPRRLLIKK